MVLLESVTALASGPCVPPWTRRSEPFGFYITVNEPWEMSRRRVGTEKCGRGVAFTGGLSFFGTGEAVLQVSVMFIGNGEGES